MKIRVQRRREGGARVGIAKVLPDQSPAVALR